jgi:uncharacterized protein
LSTSSAPVLPGVTQARNFAFPFAVDTLAQQTASAAYTAHVDQMVRQLLLTSPGERVNLPQFGCGLRALVFSPVSDALGATVKLRVIQAFDQWLAGIAAVDDVEVSTAQDDPLPEPGTVAVTVSYTVVETQTASSVTLTV